MNKVKMKRLVASPDVLFSIMKTGTSWKVFKGIPETAKLRGFTLDPMTQNLHLFIEDESFPEVDVEKQVAPSLITEFKRLK